MGGDDTNPALQSSIGDGTPPATVLPLPEGKSTKGGKGKRAAPETTQAAPTAPRAVDPDTGLELDEYGLPISGPARRQWLADAGLDDPALKPSAPETETHDG